MFSNMKAELLLNERYDVGKDAFIEMVIWRVPSPVRGSPHDFKYRFAFVENDVCTLRYDNEAGKGDHKHVDGREVEYVFESLDKLVTDFRADVRARRQK